MAIVPVSLQGSLDLSSPINPANFDLIGIFNGGATTQSGMDAVAGAAAIQAYLESFFTGILNGTIISSSVTYTAPTLTINIQGTGENDAASQPAAILLQKALGGSNDVIAFYYGTTDCPDPLYQNPEPGCQNCLDAWVGECDDVILALDFDPSTDYQVRITDFWGHTQILSKTSDPGGNITIEDADFLEGANVEHGLNLQVSIYTTANELYTFAIGNTAYTCVNLRFRAGAGDTVPDPIIGNASQV